MVVSSSCLTPDMHADGAASSSKGAQTSTQGHVILFRTPHPSLQADPYHSALHAARYRPRSVPVLTEAYHTDELARIIKTESYWSGVVISSKRAAESWIQAARAVQTESFFDWSTTRLYTVGTSSIDVLSSSELPRHLLPDLQNAQSAKNADALVSVIAPPGPRDRMYRRYLVLRGDKSTEELQTGLRVAGNGVEEVEVYSTHERPGVTHDLDEAAKEIGESRTWFAFFSPSGVKIVSPLLKAMEAGAAGKTKLERKFLAIGETTKRALETSGIQVDAVAAEPSARGVIEAIMAVDTTS